MANPKETGVNTGFGPFLDALQRARAVRQRLAAPSRVVIVGAGGVADELLCALARHADEVLDVKRLLTIVNAPAIAAVRTIEALEGEQLIHLIRSGNRELIELTPDGAGIAKALAAPEANKKRHSAENVAPPGEGPSAQF